MFQYEEMPEIQEYFSRVRLRSCCCVSVWRDARDPGILLASDWDHVVMFQYEEMPEIQEYFSCQIEIMLLRFSMRRCQRSRNTSHVRLRSCCYVSVWGDARDPGILLTSDWDHVVVFQYEEMPEIQEYFSCQIEIMLLCFSMRRCQRSRNTSRVRLRSCCYVSVWGDARDPGILLVSDWDHVVMFQHEEMPEIQEYFSCQIEIMLLCFSMRRCQRSRNTSHVVRLRSWSSRPRYLILGSCLIKPVQIVILKYPLLLNGLMRRCTEIQHKVRHVVTFQYEEVPRCI